MWVLGGEVAEWHKVGGEAKGWPDHSAQGRPGCGLQASHFLCLNEGSWKCLPVTASSPDAVSASTRRWAGARRSLLHNPLGSVATAD